MDAKPIKLFTGIVVFAVSCALQFYFASWGIYINFVFATLVAFAFLFDALELIVFILLAVLIMNWQPGPSIDIVALGAIPLVIFYAQRWLRWDRWLGAVIGIFTGVLLLYAVIAPETIIYSFRGFFIDAVLCVGFGELIIWGMA